MTHAVKQRLTWSAPARKRLKGQCWLFSPYPIWELLRLLRLYVFRVKRDALESCSLLSCGDLSGARATARVHGSIVSSVVGRGRTPSGISYPAIPLQARHTFFMGTGSAERLVTITLGFVATSESPACSFIHAPCGVGASQGQFFVFPFLPIGAENRN